MTIKRVNAPTLEEVQRTISAMEREFNISSADFQKPETYALIPEDVAADWYFALEQQSVLEHTLVLEQTYWKSASRPQRTAVCDRRAYQESVAA